MLLNASGLGAGYGAKQVIYGIDLAVAEREIVAVLGHNGAGKSTLLNALFGVIRPSAGKVAFAGADITGRKPSANVAAGLAYSLQGAEVFRTLTVTENIMLGGFALRDQAAVAAKLDSIFELFPALAERRDTRAGALSGGERQMLSMGMQLISSPRLIMLDEPSGGLSPLYVDRLYRAITDVQSRLGTSVLLIEQDLNHALDIATRVYVLANGRIVSSGPTPSDAAGVDALRRLLVGV